MANKSIHRDCIELSEKQTRAVHLLSQLHRKSPERVLSDLIKKACLEAVEPVRPKPKINCRYEGPFEPRRAVVTAFALLVWLAFPRHSEAHQAAAGWTYDRACCSNRDCSQINSNEVKIRPDGYHVRGHIFPYQDKKVRQSGDGFYHLCETPTSKAPLCLYVPLGGV